MRTVHFLMCVAIGLGSCLSLSAQDSNDFHLFPQFADGVLSNGPTYRSTLMIQSLFASPAVTCNLTLYKMTADFGAGAAATFPITVPAGGWINMRTTGSQSFQGGYATLSCNDHVYAHVLYTLYSGGVKTSEATVFSSVPALSFKLLSDQTENSRLGLAIANNTDAEHTYTLDFVNATGSTTGSVNVVVAARSSLAKFLDEVAQTTTNTITQVQIRATDFSEFSVIGLRFNGTTFTTIPAN